MLGKWVGLQWCSWTTTNTRIQRMGFCKRKDLNWGRDHHGKQAVTPPLNSSPPRHYCHSHPVRAQVHDFGPDWIVKLNKTPISRRRTRNIQILLPAPCFTNCNINCALQNQDSVPIIRICYTSNHITYLTPPLPVLLPKMSKLFPYQNN